MYICICNAIKVADLRAEAQAATGTVEDLYLRLGREPLCCQCLDEAEDIVRDARASARVPACLPH